MLQRNKFFNSVFTAVSFGVFLSLFIISVYNFRQREKESFLLNKDNNIQEYEDGSDSIFLSNFKKVYIYSNNYGDEVLENIRDSLPVSIEDKSISAKSFAVIDLDKDITLAERDSKTSLPIASITKLVTAVVAKKFIDGDKKIVIDSKSLSYSGSTAKFRLDERFTVEELLYPLLMVSSNDAAEALARAYGRKDFIKEMNNWASGIGAYSTYFADPSGLSKDNVSSIYDLVLIVKWIIENDPRIFDITSIKSKSIRLHTWTNQTKFLNLSSYSGGKNGYLPEAGRSSIALWRIGKNKKLILTVVLRSEDREMDTLRILDLALK